MFESVLSTKLFTPHPRLNAVVRPRLLERLIEGMHRKLTLVSAPAGFGRSTLVSQLSATCGRPVAWLSLDDKDDDLNRFLLYLIAAIHKSTNGVGANLHTALSSPQPPPAAAILTELINELALVEDSLLLVLDDYYLVDSAAIGDAVCFLLEHAPTQLHVLISTREDPQLPLHSLRAKGELNEFRAADLRFTAVEAETFLSRTMGLELSGDNNATLASRTEGWIAGLQLAGVSLAGSEDPEAFISPFGGSHRFVLDYLMEEVLKQRPEPVLHFLQHTSILDQMCGSLCEAVVPDLSVSGHEMLAHLERLNLFLVPLDNERRWYRYHRLFGELLRQRLYLSASQSGGESGDVISRLHLRASLWFEHHGMDIEAFHHAVTANDIDRAEHLISGTDVSLYVRGGAVPVLNWLESLPSALLDARPQLWVEFATVLAILGRFSRVEPKLRAAETALTSPTFSGVAKHLEARIADLRGLLELFAGDPRQVENMITQSRHRLEPLSHVTQPGRASGYWKLGYAYQIQGNRAASRAALTEAIASSEATGNSHINMLASTSLGFIQELAGELQQATITYKRVLHLAGTPPGPITCEAYVGLARILYEWNHLAQAEEYGRLSAHLARQLEISSFVSSEVFLARLCIAKGELDEAMSILARTQRDVLELNVPYRLPQIADVQASILIRVGDLKPAEEVIAPYSLSLSEARIHLARGKPAMAIATLDRSRKQVELQDWADVLLNIRILQSIAHQDNGDPETAMHHLGEALQQGEHEGFVRVFIDEGPKMMGLLVEANAAGIRPEHSGKLLAAFSVDGAGTLLHDEAQSPRLVSASIDRLSRREFEVLQLVAEGLSNDEISNRLFLALPTVKGHNRVIFRKLQVQRRTEAVARGRELGLL